MNDWAFLRRLTCNLSQLGSGGVMLFCLMLLFFTSCPNNSTEEFMETCPYDLQLGGHFLRVPITITPHQSIYQLGDTIRISTSTSNVIEDLGTGESFVIENFPFKPVSLLYRFVDGLDWESGFRVNGLRVDSIYDPLYSFASSTSDAFAARTRYVDDRYEFEFKLIVRETGRYILFLTDLYQLNSAGNDPERNVEADAITFDGKCPTLGYYICSMLEGPSYKENYEEELLYLDQVVYDGGLASVEAGATGPLGTGGIRLEWSGFFGFEVVE